MEPLLNNWFGIGYVAFIAITALMLWIGFRPETFPLLKLTKKQGTIPKYLGLIMAALLILAYAGFFVAAPAETTVVEEEVEWDIEASIAEMSDFATLNEVTNTINVKMSYNATSGAFVDDTGVILINFTLINNALEATGKAVCGVASIGSVNGEDIIDQNGDDSYMVEWEKVDQSISTWESSEVRVEAGDSADVTVEITLNALCLDEMDENEAVSFVLTVAGENYTVNCWLGTLAE